MRMLWFPLVLVLASVAVPLAQQQPATPPTLPPPGSLTTPPAAPNPLAPPAPSPLIPTDPAQPPGTLPQTQEQMKTPEISGPTDVMLEAKPIILFRGQSTWDDGFDTLTESFQKLAAEAKKLNLGTLGRPQAAFTATDDFGFKFDAMLVLNDDLTAPPTGLAKEFLIGKSPSGKAPRRA